MKPPALLLFLCLAFSLGAQDTRDPFQPTVSREEAELLSRVMSLATDDPAAAVELLQEERPEANASAALDFTLGNLFFQQNQLENAEAAYRAAVKKMPRFRVARMNLGRVLLLQDRPEATIEVYQELVRDGQADEEILLLLGHALLMTDAVVSAETAYRQALLLRPRHSETRIGLAKALLRQERYREGQALLAELLQQDPLNRELWSLRTSALLADQQLDLAIQSLEQARRLQQASPEMLATLGDLWLNAEQPADALNAYRQAFETETPSLPRILRAAEGFLIVQDLESAHAMLQKAESLLTASTDPKVRQQLLQRKAEHALQAGDLVTATALLQDIVRKDPLAGGALILLSQVKWQEGHIEQALLGAERAARIDGFEAEGLRLQARIEVSRGHYRQAVPLIEAAQAFEPQEAVARYLEQVKRLAD